MEELPLTVPQREGDCQIDWQIKQIYLKDVHPLCNILVISATEGVGTLFGSAHRAIPLRILPLLIGTVYNKYPAGGSDDFNAIDQSKLLACV